MGNISTVYSSLTERLGCFTFNYLSFVRSASKPDSLVGCDGEDSLKSSREIEDLLN